MHTGVGGHYFSLSAVANEIISDSNEAFVVNIGFSESPVLNSQLKCDVFNFHDSWLTTPKLLMDIIKKLRTEKFDVIHCFDENSYFFGRLVAKYFDVQIVLTKCGGPDPKYYFPHCGLTTIFSNENKEYFDRTGREVTLIANRVRAEDLSSCQNYFDNRVSSRIEGKVILCISRISKSYEKKIKQSISFSLKLTEHGVSNTLVIIGIVEDKDVFDRLKKAEDNTTVIFLTENEYTTKASNYIANADLVVGTGRGFMEASLQKKLMLCPDNIYNQLTFIDINNVNGFFEYNFSGRFANNDDNIGHLLECMNNDKILDRYYSEIKGFANSEFLLSYGIDKYKRLYSSDKFEKFNLFDAIKHYIFFTFLKVNRNGYLSRFIKLFKFKKYN